MKTNTLLSCRVTPISIPSLVCLNGLKSAGMNDEERVYSNSSGLVLLN